MTRFVRILLAIALGLCLGACELMESLEEVAFYLNVTVHGLADGLHMYLGDTVDVRVDARMVGDIDLFRIRWIGFGPSRTEPICEDTFSPPGVKEASLECTLSADALGPGTHVVSGWAWAPPTREGHKSPSGNLESNTRDQVFTVHVHERPNTSRSRRDDEHEEEEECSE